MFIRFNEVKKADEKEKILRQLRTFLYQEEPQLILFLHHTWNLQRNAITYKSLREVIMQTRISGGSTANLNFFNEISETWSRDYSKFVVDKVAPAWEKSYKFAAEKIQSKVPEWKFTGYEDGLKDWIQNSTASLVTNATETQVKAIRHVVERAAVNNELNVNTLAHAIRPMVGLTEPQAKANMNYFESLIENGVSEKVALEKSAKYAARQNRYRAMTIARTELAMAHAAGEEAAIRKAQAEGLIGEVVKQWVTAENERTCPKCAALDGVVVGLDEYFPGGYWRHPAHPNCQCNLFYIEVDNPGIHLPFKSPDEVKVEGGKIVA